MVIVNFNVDLEDKCERVARTSFFPLYNYSILTINTSLRELSQCADNKRKTDTE